MNIEVIKQGNLLRIVDSSADIPDGTRLRLFTEEELLYNQALRSAAMNLQMPSFVRGDEDECAEDLFEIPTA
jgi:hypothetical protein